MKRPLSLGILALLALAPLADAAPRESLITFEKPGKNWESQALPLGNGRLGAMIFGGIETDRIQFNENSLWTGDSNPSGGYNYGKDEKNIFGCYQNFGDLFVTFGDARPEKLFDAARTDAKNVSAYHRELNLSRALATTTFVRDGVKFTREAFVSAADQVIVLRYTADKPGALTGFINLKDGRNSKTVARANALSSPGKLANGIEYESRAIAINDGGSVRADGDDLAFKGVTTLTIVLGARTNYVPNHAKNWTEGKPGPKLDRDLAAAKKPYDKLKSASEAAHRQYMDRMEFDIGETPEARRNKSTAARLAEYKKDGNDPDLEEDLFNFSRYLLISSSRDGLPANLQGLWNDNNKPAWASDYHNNINVQMNYWGPETLNLSEMHVPLINYLKDQAEPLRRATRANKQFGPNVRGWTARTSQNITGASGWEWNIPASAWYMQHVWEHYAFNRDKNYLAKTAFPMLKEISAFWEDHLKELTADGANFESNDKNVDRSKLKGIKAGTLVAPHGWSPEHGPKEDGVAHDQQIIWDLFTNTEEAALALGDKAYATKIGKLRDRLEGPQVGSWGQLMEWMVERPNEEKSTHRHTSQLFAVYPGRQISPVKTPELAKAAVVSLKSRSNDKDEKPFTVHTTIGDSRRSWTWPWRCAMWARLGDGERAGVMVQGLLHHNTLENLFATHPPFQIDGNLGIGGGIAEMLIQSHADEIQLLPAIPKRWETGSIKGIRARGNFTVDMTWKDGRLVTADILSVSGEPINLRAGTPVTITAAGKPVAVKEKDGVVSFATKAGTTYVVTAK